MKVFVEIEEAAERLEDLIELALLGDEIVICRDGTPAATFIPIEKKEEAMWPAAGFMDIELRCSS
jgi:antitoxin (DNA-binding transcriptional repressor) of toxin-antitoxin stability system